ncbi:MAG: hypothetical protein LBB23_04685 [Rickettsiales bacterium]|jgi:hypothetical protein|nr:hypothetical protein [Rickettsiales bacterium]
MAETYTHTHTHTYKLYKLIFAAFVFSTLISPSFCQNFEFPIQDFKISRYNDCQQEKYKQIQENIDSGTLKIDIEKFKNNIISEFMDKPRDVNVREIEGKFRIYANIVINRVALGGVAIAPTCSELNKELVASGSINMKLSSCKNAKEIKQALNENKYRHMSEDIWLRNFILGEANKLCKAEPAKTEAKVEARPKEKSECDEDLAQKIKNHYAATNPYEMPDLCKACGQNKLNDFFTNVLPKIKAKYKIEPTLAGLFCLEGLTALKSSGYLEEPAMPEAKVEVAAKPEPATKPDVVEKSVAPKISDNVEVQEFFNEFYKLLN